MDETCRRPVARGRCPSRTPPLSANAGFTVLELFIVLFIVALLAAIGFTALQTQLPRIRLDNVTNATDVLFKRARLQAIRRASDVSIALEDDTDTVVTVADIYAMPDPDKGYRLVARDRNGDEVAHAPIPNPSSGSANHIGLREIAFPNEEIVYRQDGSLEAVGHVLFGYLTSATTMWVRQLEITSLAGTMDDTTYEYTGILP